jgi:hypothetical protein
MVDFIKRAANTGDLLPGEQVLGACNVTPSPFSVQNAGMTGGLIAGGIAGMAVGAVWDRHLSKKDEADAVDKETPPLVARPQFETEMPTNGALVAVTANRVVAWKISGLGKPKEVILSAPLSDIDEVWWEKAPKQLLRGKPASTLIWVGISGHVLPMAAISTGPAQKYVQLFIDALEQRLPGKVSEFTSE